ncbi:MAG: thermonuclease family protein [Gammaproteobacteria bacterium]|nr:thermonuclease family protein [Gammaproteobacteria bacterium]
MRNRPSIRLISGIALLFLAPLVAAENYYRWQDSQGVQHYTELPPAGVDVETISVESGHGFHRVAKVYDGDTVLLENGMKIRLIGINTPEIAHRNRPEDPGGEVASRFLKRLIEGKLVRLEYGAERHDKYQRVLAHLFTEQGENINARILKEGLAHAVVKLPNIRLIEAYFSAENEARSLQLGIWSLPQFQIYPVEQAGEFRNTFRRLSGLVKRVEEKRSAWLLHFNRGVKVLIRKEHLKPFMDQNRHPEQLVGKHILFRGWVHQSRGAPLIRLYHPKMIEQVDG